MYFYAPLAYKAGDACIGDLVAVLIKFPLGGMILFDTSCTYLFIEKVSCWLDVFFFVVNIGCVFIFTHMHLMCLFHIFILSALFNLVFPMIPNLMKYLI